MHDEGIVALLGDGAVKIALRWVRRKLARRFAVKKDSRRLVEKL